MRHSALASDAVRLVIPTSLFVICNERPLYRRSTTFEGTHRRCLSKSSCLTAACVNTTSAFPLDVVQDIGPGLTKAAIAAEANGETVDLCTTLPDSGEVSLRI